MPDDNEQPPKLPEPDKEAEPFTLVVEAGSELETLLTMYEPLKAEYEAAEARFEMVKAAIKRRAIEQAPQGTPEIRIASRHIRGVPVWKAMVLAWRTPWHFEMKALKQSDPVTYVRYAVRKGRWELGADRSRKHQT